MAKAGEVFNRRAFFWIKEVGKVDVVSIRRGLLDKR
ncbi:hypothetical protein SAMN05877842_101538 [Ureibacillus acetophenoni]|uniref:Uncharacterized protein n=1 Tax=Ureibacillus acetophenoni TaxID=614649 RepID=A0A285U1F2_9BACL|nr:hypothetical protein SAMN05877842_101538 [Ureibacillus acetophenoni]